MSGLPTKQQLESAAGIISVHMPPTPIIRWPLLAERTGAEVWVKHENHTPIGAFKIRGGLNFMTKLHEAEP
ncbi:MAG TPA: pyridoxal-phosphate dependent enzyme, partial [Rhodospirillales bacterium]|nr:pyridoxal-phosphate dependent enzyme [Rhodospirillales bacterium]